MSTCFMNIVAPPTSWNFYEWSGTTNLLERLYLVKTFYLQLMEFKFLI